MDIDPSLSESMSADIGDEEPIPQGVADKLNGEESTWTGVADGSLKDIAPSIGSDDHRHEDAAQQKENLDELSMLPYAATYPDSTPSPTTSRYSLRDR